MRIGRGEGPKDGDALPCCDGHSAYLAEEPVVGGLWLVHCHECFASTALRNSPGNAVRDWIAGRLDQGPLSWERK